MPTDLERPAVHAPPRRRRSALPRWLSPVALVAVLTIALLIGGGAFSGHAPTDQERAASLEAQIRCPSCEDLSVAQSSTSSAIAVRHQIAAMIAAGQSDQAIESSLVARYGGTILLKPPDSGLTSFVWILPAVAGAGALVILGVLFWRRSQDLARLREEQP